MKQWVTPALVVVGLLVVGFGIRQIIVKRAGKRSVEPAPATRGAGDDDGGGGLLAGPDDERLPPDEVDQPRDDPDTEENWEELHHPFIGYPSESARAEEIKIEFPKGRAEHPLDDMVSVPAGEFWLGDDKLATAGPRARIFVKAFQIDRYEVTNRQYQAFLKAENHPQPELRDEWARDYSWREQEFPPGTGDRPVVMVTFDDARKYCRFAGKRLPTEEEWEKAARGPQGNRWPWGNQWDGRKAHTAERFSGPLATLAEWQRFEESFDADQLIHPFPVGSYPEDSSSYGVIDMHGNVSEWVDGIFEAYDGGVEGASALYGQKSIAIVRGNSYGNRDYAAPAAVRYPFKATHRDVTIGFRCARDM